MRVDLLPVLSVLTHLSLVPVNGAPHIRRKTKTLSKFRYHECGRNRNKAIQLLGLDLDPVPIRVPGKLSLKIRANVTRPIPNNLDLKFKVEKRITISKTNFWLPLPCFNPLSSRGKFCKVYDIPTCSLVGAILACPLRQKLYSVSNTLAIPRPAALSKTLLSGQYRAMVKVRHPVTNELLACVKGRFRVKNA